MYQKGDVVAILQAKRSFYASLCSGARNLIALSLIERLCLRVSSLRSRAPGRGARNAISASEIARIASAVEARDAGAAKSAMSDHLASVARWTLSTLDQGPAVLTSIEGALRAQAIYEADPLGE